MKFHGICAIVFAALGFSSVAALAHDGANDFSSTVNTANSHWSYRYDTTGTHSGTYTLLPHYALNTGISWKNGGSPFATSAWSPATLIDGRSAAQFPYIGANSGAQLTTGTIPIVYVWPTDMIFMHPAPTGDAVVSFLIEKNGTANIKYSFENLAAGGDGVRWYIDKNGSPDLAQGVLVPTTSPLHLSTTGMQTLSVPVVAGDRLNFIVDSGGAHNYGADWTGARIKITQ